MKKKITLLLFSFLVIKTYAQDVMINWGPEYKKEDGLISFIRFGGHSENAYYVVSQTMRNSTIYIYDYNHKLLGTQSIDLKYGKSDISLNGSVRTRSGNYFILGGVDMKEDKGTFYYTTALANNKLNTNYTNVFEYPFNWKKGFNIDMGADDYSNISCDSSKVLSLCPQGFQDSKDKMSLGYLVLDDKMNIIYKFDEFLPYSKSKFDLIGSSVLNNSDACFLGKLYENDKDRKTPDYKFYLIKCNSKNALKETQITLNAAAPLNGRIIDLENGNLIVVGSYTNISNNKSLRANGSYSVVLNANGDVISSNIYPFAGAVKEELFGENENKADKGTVNYNVKKILLNKQTQDVTVCFEKEYVNTKTVTTTRDPFGTSNGMMYHGNTTDRTTNYYHTDDIIVVSFEATGKKKFETVIDKDFEFVDSKGPTSFSFCENNGNYYFLFNDKKTLSEKKDTEVKGKILTDLVKMDENGKVIFRKTIFGNKDVDMVFSPKMSDYIGNGKLLIHSVMAKKYKYGIVSLP